MTYTTTTDNRIQVISDDRRSTFPAMVLSTCAGGKMLTVIRMDGKGTGRPFVISVKEVK